MKHFVAKRILGGIAWACAMLMTHTASSQDGYRNPVAGTLALEQSNRNPPTSQTGLPSQEVLSFQPGLSSKEYLRLMAEANDKKLSSPSTPVPSADPAVHLANTATNTPVPSVATSSASTSPASVPIDRTATNPDHDTSAHRFVQSNGGVSYGMQPPPSQLATQSDTATRERSWTSSPVGNYGTMNPRFSIGFESVWMHRSGDEGTTWSTGGSLRSFGEDRATMTRLGWYSNPMERYEFAYLGSLVWHRRTESTQPADSLLTPSLSEPDWFASFQNSMQHEQFHSGRLRSYELNKRWITDDLGNYFLGLNVIDYREEYGLRTIDADGSGALGLSTRNLLAGMQGGIELWHPLSQRFAVGGQGILGLYGNFAEGDWNVNVENEGGFFREDQRFQTAAGFGINANARYQFTSRLYAFAGYRWWYLAGMATVDDQTVGPLASDAPLALSTDAGFLLQGAACGLEFVF